MKNLETGLEYACPDMSEVRFRQCGRKKTASDYLTGAYIWCLQQSDYESAMLLKTHIRKCFDGYEPDGCRLCRPDPFAGIEKPFLSIREAESERKAELDVENSCAEREQGRYTEEAA